MAGMGNSQIINGQSYQMYTPEWYQAQQADTIRRAGIGGAAQGAGQANYMNAVSPSLAGLYAAIGQPNAGSLGSIQQPGTRPTVPYPTK